MASERRTSRGLLRGLVVWVAVSLVACAAEEVRAPASDVGARDAGADATLPPPPDGGPNDLGPPPPPDVGPPPPPDVGPPPPPPDVGPPPPPPDTGPPPPPPDMGPPPMDVGPPPADTGPLDMGRADTGPPDMGRDTGATDSGPRDTGPRDSGSDAGPMRTCPMGTECNILTQTGCTSIADACDVAFNADGTVTPYCRSAGARRDGELCTVPEDCREGLACVGTTPTTRICRPMCCDNDDTQCPAGQFCRVTIVDEAGAPTGLQLCDGYEPCDPLTSVGCSSGMQCYPAAEDGSTDCADPGTAAEGDTCDYINSCQAGLLCINTGVCARMCRLSGGSPGCGAGQTCRGGFTGFPTIGVCNP